MSRHIALIYEDACREQQRQQSPYLQSIDMEAV